MKKLSVLLAMSLLLVLIGVLAVPAAAQEEGGPGEGGIIVFDNTADDPATFNPLIASDTTSAAVTDWLYPSLFTINWQTGQSEPNQPDGLAAGWEYDETGTVVTITLRDNLAWNDGTPITAADYLWAVDAIRSGETSSSRTYVFETLADGTPSGGKVVSIEAPDDYTVVVTFSEPDCIAFEDLNDITVVPAHVFDELYGSNYGLMDENPRDIPTVTFGPFRDLEFDPGSRVSLIADQSYPDAILGYVSPEEWVYLSLPDENIATERFIAGDLTLLAVPSTRQNDFRTDPNLADFQTFEFTGNGFVFFAMNTSDPNNPAPGVDADGNIVEQPMHPVLGDVRVRQAITQAVDVGAIIEGIRDGNGVLVATHTIPTSWVYNEDLQYTFDTDTAAALLDEAGWVDHDGNPSTPRVCQGCLYATEVDPSFEGSTLDVRVRVPAGGIVGERMGEFFQASLNDVGFNADFQAIDWGTAFLPELVGQTFDLALLSWSLGLPVDPDMSWAYGPEADQPGSGFNFTSYFNAEFNQLMADARNPETTNGCDPEARRELYLRAQELLHVEAPYMYLYVAESMTAAQPNLENWNPTPFSRIYSADAWRLIDTP